MLLHMKSFECLGDTFLLIHLLLQDKSGLRISDPKKKEKCHSKEEGVGKVPKK
jgi:hypothetical protein